MPAQIMRELRLRHRERLHRLFTYCLWIKTVFNGIYTSNFI